MILLSPFVLRCQEHSHLLLKQKTDLAKKRFSLVPSPCLPPSEKRSGDKTRSSFSCSSKAFLLLTLACGYFDTASDSSLVPGPLH